MSDYLLDLSQNPFAKSMVRKLKLPISLPELLLRNQSPWQEGELKGATIAVNGGRQSTLLPMLRAGIKAAGGMDIGLYEPEQKLSGLLFDASCLTAPQDLGMIYDFIKPRLKALSSNGRIVLIGGDGAASPTAAAIAAALIGLVKSLAKEVGRRGATCNLLTLPPGIDPALGSAMLSTPLSFFLSPRSAFISGQCLALSAPSASYVEPPAQGRLSGKTALVTGAAQGIGAAIALRLAAEGAHVIGLDRPQEKDRLLALMQEIKGTPLTHDLLRHEAPVVLYDLLAGDGRRIDILVNNAGITRDKTLARMPRDWWDDTLTLNLLTPMHLTDTLLGLQRPGSQGLLKAHGADTHARPALMAAGGRVICMSSVAGIAGNAGQTNYATAKSGLIGYVRAMAPMLRERQITINAIAPGFIETRMTQAMPFSIREVARRLSALGQAGLPGDVAEAAVLLALPEAAAVTGQVLRVCGLNLIGA